MFIRKFLLAFLLLTGLNILPSNAASVVFLDGAGDSDMLELSFKKMRLPKEIHFSFFCHGVDEWNKIKQAAAAADVLIIDARVSNLRKLLTSDIDFSHCRVYVLSSRLLRGKFPNALEPQKIQAYRSNRRPENYRNMVLWIINRELDKSVKFAPPITIPPIGVTHPDAKKIFHSIAEYKNWAKKNGHFRENSGIVALTIHAGRMNNTELSLFRHLTKEFERQGLNIAIVYGDEVSIIHKILLDSKGKPTVDALLALSFKFKSGLGKALSQAIKKLDLPIYNGLRLYRQTTREWEKSAQGMNNFSVAFAFIAPEISGMIEPLLLFGNRNVIKGKRKIQYAEPFPAAIKTAAKRIRKQIELRRKPNHNKHVAIFIYNGAGGKQSIGASYMNVPRSLITIIKHLNKAGYSTGELAVLDEKAMTEALQKNARNVGSWAPGELDSLLASGTPVRMPFAKYQQYFSLLPRQFQEDVIKAWGKPGDMKIMTDRGDFIIPVLHGGNLLILPEPMRGWVDDPHKLIHSSKLPPHHQYLAVYFYLQHEFKADAMINLGRHGSGEWLPGKQLGLSPGCAPLLIRGDIPVIYPYIMDGIGEGIIAKRRASAVMIDHLTPVIKIPKEEEKWIRLREALTALKVADPSLRKRKEMELANLARKYGLPEKTSSNVSDIEEFLDARKIPTPYGLHSFGISPSPEGVAAMTKQVQEASREKFGALLESSGQDELISLTNALSGHFISPGPSDDPLRNPDALPSGRNFYSFDPKKIPTKAAMQLGRKAADELLKREFKKRGRYPRKVGVVLWAGETTRTDGVNEGMILALLGMKTTYDRTGRVNGVIPIPGAQLGRPRIDVLVTTSGAYRDQFGDMIVLLNKAMRQAERLNDVENFLKSNAKDNPGEHCRIFFPAPATYGTRINKLAGASGIWEHDDEIAELYRRSMSWSIDKKGTFVKAEKELKRNLAQVEAVLHSRSSNVYGVTDIDDMYQYLGGLSMAVRKSSGSSPSEYILNQRRKERASLMPLRDFISSELDTRVLNREWISAMQKENYSGGHVLARTVDNIWGWQAVTPDNITSADWNSLYEVYVQDRYNLEMKKFFSENNEWAFQSMTGRMLEAVRKNYWSPESSIRQQLAKRYALSVIRQGMACCDHTCNNPLLNQMVVNIISMPGVLSPELVMKFQIAVEKSAKKALADQVQERRNLQKSLAESFGKKIAQKQDKGRQNTEKETGNMKNSPVPVKGYRMKDSSTAEKTQMSSSGIQYIIILAIIVLLGIFAFGWKKGEA